MAEEKLTAENITQGTRQELLLAAAKRPTGQGRIVARWILGMYNGDENRVDLTDLRALDPNLKQAIIEELWEDTKGGEEIHERMGIGDKGIEEIRRIQGWSGEGSNRSVMEQIEKERAVSDQRYFLLEDSLHVLQWADDDNKNNDTTKKVVRLMINKLQEELFKSPRPERSSTTPLFWEEYVEKEKKHRDNDMGY
mgnify:CR=1 FL=1